MEYMTSKECADYLKVHVNTLYKYVRKEHLPVLKFPGRRKWVFRKDLVDRWVEKRSMPVITNEQKNQDYGKLRILQP